MSRFAKIRRAKLDQFATDFTDYFSFSHVRAPLSTCLALDVDFLLDFDFLEDPIFVTPDAEDANAESKLSEVEQVELREFFQLQRKSAFRDFGIIMSTAVDPKRSLITQKGPSFGIVKKIQTLARASYLQVRISGRLEMSIRFRQMCFI